MRITPAFELNPAQQNDPARIDKVARQLEGQFAQMLVKSMRDASFGDSLFPGENKMFREMYDQKIADGKKRAQELTDRFAAWYYVTTGDSFRAINLDRAELVQTKKAEAPGGPGANPFGGLGGPGGSFPHPNISPGSLPQVR